MTLKDIQGCILIPTYNNQKTLAQVIEGVLQYADKGEVIIVNDGSTDGTHAILEKYNAQIHVFHNDRNRGKGYSLRRGFEESLALGFKNVITIDSDGQHLPADLPLFFEMALQNQGAVIMGSRNMNQADVPGKSSFGNKFSNFWFKFETGISLPDTQTGFRLYPLEPIRRINLFTSKFETEIEVIVKLAWKDVPIIPIDIQVIYEMEERVTHFRPFQDFTRISILNTYFVVLTFLFYLPRRLFRLIREKGLWQIIKKEALKPSETNFAKAQAIGFGIFMGIVPIWGFQLMIGIPLSIYFKMNKVLFLAATNISLPPLIPLIIFGSYKFGGLFYMNTIQLHTIEDISLESIHLNFLQYFIGGTILALLSGGISFLVSYGLLKLFRKDHQLKNE